MHNMAVVSSGPHISDGLLSGESQSQNVDLQNLLPLLEPARLEVPRVAQTGRVHQDIDASQPGPNLLKARTDGAFVAKVYDHGVQRVGLSGVRGIALGERLETGSSSSPGHHSSALLVQPASDGRPDSARCPGHERNPPPQRRTLEICHWASLTRSGSDSNRRNWFTSYGHRAVTWISAESPLGGPVERLSHLKGVARPLEQVEGMSALPPLSDKLIEKLDVPGPRYTSYPTVPEWRSDYGPQELEEALQAASAEPEEPLGLYVHIPFCEERCSFCGCNVVVTRSAEKAERYLDYIEREMDLAVPHLGQRRTIRQLHWGGGTPTFLTEAQIRRLFGMIESRFEIAEDAEVALEVDPKVTTFEQIDLLGQLGFNRMSMGVQDFDPSVQDAINRVQTFEETQEVVRRARAAGFRGINFDLIYGLPRQTLESWERTISKINELRPDRLAIYGFAFLPELRPHQKRLPVADIPEGSTKHALFRLAWERLTLAGYEPIGLDHFALPQDELSRAAKERRLGRNFQGYTVRAARDTVAFGLTAISDVAGHLAQNFPQMKKYEAALEEGRLPTMRGIERSRDDKERGQIITELMCNSWVDLGPNAETHYGDELAQLRELAELGLVEVRAPEVELTPLGRFFVRNVAMVFDAYLEGNRHRFSRTV